MSFEEYRVKIALLGPDEALKTTFFDDLVTQKLPSKSKAIIGLSVGSLAVETSLLSPPVIRNVSISILDVACSPEFSSLRAQYYRGSAAILVVLEEGSFELAREYYAEIRQQDPAILVGVVILCEISHLDKVPDLLKDPTYNQFQGVLLQNIRNSVYWVLKTLARNLNNGQSRIKGGILLLPKSSLLEDGPRESRYQIFEPVVEHTSMPTEDPSVNVLALERLVTRLGLSVRDRIISVKNRFGEFRVSLTKGKVRFTSQRCLQCQETCKQQKEICIVAGSQGFSSCVGIKQAEMLVIAKILAIQDENMPRQVIKQISRSQRCPNPWKRLLHKPRLRMVRG